MGGQRVAADLRPQTVHAGQHGENVEAELLPGSDTCFLPPASRCLTGSPESRLRPHLGPNRAKRDGTETLGRLSSEPELMQ